MSLINFDILADEKHELRQVWERMDDWFQRHPTRKYVDVRRLSRDLADISVAKLAVALDLMARRGLLRQVFRVLTPEGVLLDRDFDSPLDVPDRMPNRFESSSFDTSEGDIVSGYVLEAKGGRR
jgi:hypothetical protein